MIIKISKQNIKEIIGEEKLKAFLFYLIIGAWFFDLLLLSLCIITAYLFAFDFGFETITKLGYNMDPQIIIESNLLGRIAIWVIMFVFLRSQLKAR